MTPAHRQLLDSAVRGVMGPVLRDFKRGAVDEGDVIEMTRRRANAIRASFRAGLAPPAALTCAGCQAQVDAELVAMIAGRPYCRSCAPKHRKTPPPRRGS